MDGILSAIATLKQVKDLRTQLAGLCMAGGFSLKKWVINNEIILQNVPIENLSFENDR